MLPTLFGMSFPVGDPALARLDQLLEEADFLLAVHADDTGVSRQRSF
jgi:hypothetical protein